MKCARARARLERHLEGDLHRSQSARLAAHLERCRSCSQELEALRRTVDLVRGLPDPAPPAHLAERVMARVRDEGAGRPGAPAAALRAERARAPWAGATAALAAAGLVSVAVLVLLVQSSGTPGGAGLAGVDPGRAPELELPGPVGASQAPDPAEAPDAATLDAWLHRLRTEPASFLHAWTQVEPAARERLGLRLAKRARARGESEALAVMLRRTDHPAADALAARLTTVETPSSEEPDRQLR